MPGERLAVAENHEDLGTSRWLLERLELLPALKEGAHEGTRGSLVLKQIDVDFGLGQPAVACTLAAKPPVGDPHEDEADQ